MIRVVLAVVLTTALLGASLPAIDDARRDHTDAAIRAELRTVERAATSLLETDDPTDDGARRVVTVRLPTRSWTDARTEEVTIGPATDGRGGRFSWTVAGGTRQVRRLAEVPLRTPDGDPVSLTGTGRKRLVLSLDGSSAEPVVTVRRFTRDHGPTRAHATVVAESRGVLPRHLHL